MREINQHAESVDGTNEVIASIQVTFEDFKNGAWSEYLDNRNVAPSTRRAYESSLRRHILPKLGSKRLSEITPVDISDLLKSTRNGGTAPKSRLNVYTQLKTMFAVAEDSDLVERSPVRRKIHRPIYEAEEKSAWSAEL
jgi:site-specific recombinase XerD